MDLGLSGRAVLVAGASRGIGRAIAGTLVREGAKVFLTARGAEDLTRAESELRAAGGTVASLAVDLASAEGAQRAVEGAIAAFGGLDVLVNNAGGSMSTGSFENATEAQWTQVVNLNLMAAVWCSRHAVSWMREHGGGCVLHISSICGIEYCTSAPYTAAKAAIHGLTKEMAVDLAKYNIRVNAVAPGSILFPGGSWDRRRKEKPERFEKVLKEELPFGRFGKPEEIAEVVTFLCSPRASWVSGSIVVVDGAQCKAV
jgi:3-oxoacyl-[acyl-carrier protein] reductase